MVNQPFYVSPEQLMADRADFARKGIAKGRSVIVAQYDKGIAFLTENPSRAIHKFSEIYDKIGFAAVGKYNEFENLRVAGIRYADMRGFTYDRSDVTARGLANAYAQTMGTAFTTDSKPLEVEIVVAEVGDTPSEDLIYRLLFDGSVAEENGFVVIGGQAATLANAMSARWQPELSLQEVMQIMAHTLGEASAIRKAEVQGDSRVTAGESSLSESLPEPLKLTGQGLEAAVLDRTRARRKFKRMTPEKIDEILGENN